jgi:acetolactate synthase-1/2/3 large subunit
MARGLLGPDDPLQHRHSRKEALKEADVVLLAGVPCDFRLDYGRQISRRATLIAVNRSRGDLNRNRRPNVPALGDPAQFLADLAAQHSGREWPAWRERLRARDLAREQKIDADAAEVAEGGLNPLAVCRALDAVLADDSVLVADGGDFVATASYTVRPRGPLRWLDPGPFGTLGVGAGFAMATKVAQPDTEVWLLYGDGSVGFSLSEFDTFARHRLGVIAVVGNDAAWMQIARDQVDLLGDDVGCTLARTDYHLAAAGLGAVGLLVTKIEELQPALEQAKAHAAAGSPVLLNVHLGRTDFRKGSLSM